MRRFLFIVVVLCTTLPAFAENAHVFIRRPFQYVGSAIAHNLIINDVSVGGITSGSSIDVSVPSGQVTIADIFGLSSIRTIITLDVKEGERYYVRINEALGSLVIETDVDERKFAKATPIDISMLEKTLVAGNSDFQTGKSEHRESVIFENKQEDVYKANDYIPVKEGELWGYKQFGEWVIKPAFETAATFTDGLAVVSKFGKYGFINKEGVNVIPYKYEKACSFSEGLSAVCMFGKWGFIDLNGVVVISHKFDKAGNFNDGLSFVSLNGKIGFIDKDEVWYNSQSDRMSSFKGYTKKYVEQQVNEWQKKGKYEKTDAWRERVSDVNRKSMIEQFVKEAQSSYISEQSKKIITTETIEGYDADNEVFLINDSKFGSILVPVPIMEAESFENEFLQYTRINKYNVENDGLGLAEVSFVKGDKIYKYNNDAPLQFTSVDIDYVFESVDFDAVPVDVPKNRQTISSRSEKAIVRADVDMSIPSSGKQNENTFAVIIANENYKREASVDYASNDGSIFKEYCTKTLGLPDKNIRMVVDATYLDMQAEVSWISNVAKSYKGNAQLILYYAGHGIPDESSKDAYLLPVDGMGSNPATGYKLSDLYAKLGEYPTKSTVVFLDACFSGAQRSGTMMASARGIAIKSKPASPIGNMVVLSAASGDETAYPYKEKGHGMFTYYLLKILQKTNGRANLKEISEYVSEEVGKRSIVENTKSQTPSVMVSPTMTEDWRSIVLYE